MSDRRTPNAASPTFAEALRYWFKLGWIGFGGPAGQIAIMHRDLVERRKWIAEDRFVHALNFCTLLPGPEAQQLATYIGWLLHGTRGGLAAGILFVLPSVFILLALSYAYAALGKLPAVVGIFAGIKPVVLPIVLDACFRIGKRALPNARARLIAVASFVAMQWLGVPFPAIVLAAAAVGLLGLKTGQSPEIPDPPPNVSPRKNWRIITLGLAFWVGPLAALVGWAGWTGLVTRQYLFFTQAALVTFGGAYAVLGYVTDRAVRSFGWLTPAQAVDGLALAETTPGPLIMVLQFVGFMAGWNVGGGPGSALAGALVTTYATFLPCFVFVFLGAPYVERLRGNRRVAAALAGVTAAAAGVILNLALVFGKAVLFPAGWVGGPDWFGAIIALTAGVALFRFKVDIPWLVVAGGVVGWILG